jgi:hypothetical protein
MRGQYYGIDALSPIAAPIPSPLTAPRLLTVRGQNIRNYDETGTLPNIKCLFTLVTLPDLSGSGEGHAVRVPVGAVAEAPQVVHVSYAAAGLSLAQQFVLCAEPCIPGMQTGPVTVDLDMGQLPLGLDKTVPTRDGLVYVRALSLSHTHTQREREKERERETGRERERERERRTDRKQTEKKTHTNTHTHTHTHTHTPAQNAFDNR